jgi:hypothetical protein
VHLVDHPEPVCLGSGDGVTGHQHLECLPAGQGARQQGG